MKDILRGSALIFGFKIIGAISLFLVQIFIARFYGASELGIYNLVLSLLLFGSMFSKMGLDMYVLRMLPEIEDNSFLMAGFLQKVFKLLLLSSITISLFIYLLLPLLNQYIFKSFDASLYLNLLVFMIIPATYFFVVPEIYRGLGDVRLYAFFRNVSQSFFMLLALMVALFLFNKKIDPVYTLYLVVLLLTVILFFILNILFKHKKIYIFKSAVYKKRILKYSYPMLFTSTMMFAMGNVDNFMISLYIDELHVGIYSACVKFSVLITFVSASINGYIAPKISKAYSKKNYGEVKRIYHNSVVINSLVSIPVFLVLLIFPEFFLGFFGEEFKVASATLSIINVAFIINALFCSVGYLLIMTDNQFVFMLILLVGLILNVIFNYLLIPIYQINGAAFATLISMIFWNLGSFLYLKKIKII